MEIKTARHKALKAILAGDRKPKGLDPKVAAKIRHQVSILEASPTIQSVAASFPGWRVHELTPAFPGKWSLWVTGNYRLTFYLNHQTGDITVLDFEDYH